MEEAAKAREGITALLGITDRLVKKLEKGSKPEVLLSPLAPLKEVLKVRGSVSSNPKAVDFVKNFSVHSYTTVNGRRVFL